MTLLELKAALEKATGPDRNLDAAIQDLIGCTHALPTASIDAAVTLEVEGLQEVVVRRYPRGVYVRWTAADGKAHYGSPEDRLLPTEPLARSYARVEYELAKAST